MPILDHRTDEESQDGKAVNDRKPLWLKFCLYENCQNLRKCGTAQTYESLPSGY